MNQEKIISESEKEKALEILRQYETQQCTHLIRDNIEDDCPSQDYEIGEPSGECETDGHYMCENCIHKNPENQLTK